MKKTIVTITVDTEFSTHKDDMGIFGRISGKEYGVSMMREILDRHGLKATFFIDVFTNKKEFIPSLQSVCMDLKQRGHDLQLHTHPIHMFGNDGIAMKDYRDSEQIAIVLKGRETFRELFGEYPIAHRAGDWGANRNTLKALDVMGMKCDSSMFYGWKNCELNPMKLTKNRVVQYNQMWEIPASVFECVGMGMFSPYRLLSTDGNSFEETWAMLKKMQAANLPVITTVYHSFSFIKWNKTRTQYFVDANRIKKFERFMKVLSEDPSLEVKTIKQVCDELPQHSDWITSGNDIVPKSGLGASVLRLADRLASRT